MHASHLHVHTRLASAYTPRIRMHALHPQGLCIVKDEDQIKEFTSASEVMARGVNIDGLKVFIPKNFFDVALLPTDHQTMTGYAMHDMHTSRCIHTLHLHA